MAEKKPQETEPESSEFATQKIDREELFGAEAEKKELEHATQKIDDSVLEAAVAQQAMDSAATMKVSETELKQAMAEEMEKAKQPASSAPVKEPPLTGEVVDKPSAAKEGKSTTNTTIVAIIAAAVVLLACICVCPLTVAAIVYFTNQ
jgi:hypothetical protein